MTIISGKLKSPVEIITESSFTFWQQKDFRKLVRFDSLDQTEQDRIFNELEVTALGLTLIYSEQTGDENIHKEISAQFVKVMENLGIEKKFLKIWEKLIDLRFKEYKKDYADALKASEDWKEFKNEEKLRKAWARIETLSIDGWIHIRRGDTKEQDPLWVMIRRWVLVVDSQLVQALNLSDKLLPSGKAN